MRFERLEEVLARAAAEADFRRKLVKKEADVKSEFGLSDAESKVLDTLLAGQDAPGLQALLSVMKTTPAPASAAPAFTTATANPATGADVQRISQLVEKKLARLENTEADVLRISQVVEKKLARLESSGADVQRISQVVEKKLARLEGTEADVQRISQVVEKKLARLESSGADIQRINQVVEKKLARLEALEAKSKG
jgi:hypothetical protein